MTGVVPRVLIHVGTPKSGSTFIQESLEKNRALLRASGVHYPKGGIDLMFRAALEIRGNHRAWGRTRAEVAGSWKRLTREARRCGGTLVISHELLGAAEPAAIASALTALDGVEIHVVVTARDLGHQLVAEWQDGVKHGRTHSFAHYADRVLVPGSDTGHARRFMAAQELPTLLGRWGAGLPAHHVHLVCSPGPHADRGELWRLFGQVAGFQADGMDPAEPRLGNASLGVAQIDLLRRVNTALDRRLVQPDYGRVVKQYLAQEVLASTPYAGPLLPPELLPTVAEISQRWREDVVAAGWRIHGDLSNLEPRTAADRGSHPDLVNPRAELDTAAAALAELLLELHRNQQHARRTWRPAHLVKPRSTATPVNATDLPTPRRQHPPPSPDPMLADLGSRDDPESPWSQLSREVWT